MFTRSDRLRPNTILSRLSGTESDKSFVDDFDMERGIVSMRVGLSYDLLRLSPCSGDLFNRKPRGRFLSRKLASHPPNNPPSKHTTTTQEPQKFHLPDRMDRVGIRWTRYFFYLSTSVNRLKNSPHCSRNVSKISVPK